MVESIYGDVEEEFMKQEIVMPYAFRGLLILMMGPDYDKFDTSFD